MPVQNHAEVVVRKENDAIGLKVGDAKGERAYPMAIKVLESGAAAASGITVGVYIVKVNGKDCRGRSGHAVHEMVRDCSNGSDIHFVVKRRGKVLMTSMAGANALSLGVKSAAGEQLARDERVALMSPEGDAVAAGDSEGAGEGPTLQRAAAAGAAASGLGAALGTDGSDCHAEGGDGGPASVDPSGAVRRDSLLGDADLELFAAAAGATTPETAPEE
mmetsp:Transcript_9977/g.25601  ORF Transcript_9977/g.25601 Transcript_9977/m.25601 type:complete len:218 (+) Transcript_9977:50-703(+)